MPIAAQDRTAWWILATWIAFSAALILAFVALNVLRAFFEFDSALATLPVLAIFLFALLILAIFWIFFLVPSLWRRQWQRAISVLIAPVLACALPYLAWYSEISPRFMIERIRFDRAIAALPDPPGSRYREFQWNNSGSAAGGNINEMVVYDETQRLPDRIKSGSTRWHPERTTVKAMGGHYYWVSEAL